MIEVSKDTLYVRGEDGTFRPVNVFGAGGGAYVLPTASADTLGGVKVGNGLQMDGEALGVVPEGMYELIETITLDEDMLFERTAEPDGTPYNFTRLYVIFKTKAVSTLGFNANFKYGNGAFSPPLWVAGVTGNTDGTEWIGYIEAGWENGLWRNRYRPFTRNNYILGIQENANIAVVKTLDGVRTSMPVSAGTMIEIWGVRASA